MKRWEHRREERHNENLWHSTRWQRVAKESWFVTESGRRERLRDDRRSELGESCYEGISERAKERNNWRFFFPWMREQLIREEEEIKWDPKNKGIFVHAVGKLKREWGWTNLGYKLITGHQIGWILQFSLNYRGHV